MCTPDFMFQMSLKSAKIFFSLIAPAKRETVKLWDTYFFLYIKQYMYFHNNFRNFSKTFKII